MSYCRSARFGKENVGPNKPRQFRTQHHNTLHTAKQFFLGDGATKEMLKVDVRS